MRHHAKCCADRSNRCRDRPMVIFKLLGCRPPPSCISLDLKFVTDQTDKRSPGPNCVTVLNFVETVAEIWRFFKLAAARLDF